MDTTAVTPRTVARLAEFARTQHGGRLATRVKRDGTWEDRPYDSVAADIERLAIAFVEHGLAPGDPVCILSDTRPEWSVVSYALWSAGAVVVPIYPSNSPGECEWVARNSGAVAIVVENSTQLAKIDLVRHALAALRVIFMIESHRAVDGVLALDDVMASAGSPDELARRRSAVGPDDLALIIYTSGTTGPPKGCMLTHRNAMALCSIVLDIEILRTGETAYLYLPFAHVFAQIVQLAAFQVGAVIAYFGGDTKQIIAELMEVLPGFLPSVPRIFEKLYALAMAQVPPDDQQDLRRAIGIGIRVRTLEAADEPVPDALRQPFERADERVFANVRALFGGNLREALTGAAPIAPEILEFFYAAGVPVMEGYGMTETMAIGTVNRQGAVRFGTVGRALPGVEIRIAKSGEILMRGPHVFAGYWENETATREVLDAAGWLHTGDLGVLDDDGFLSITGRIKDIIITAGGKNLTPANLENDLRQSPFVSHAVMYGDRGPYPVALVTLEPETIIPWARARGMRQDVAGLSRHPAVRTLVREALNQANAGYAQVEQIKRFAILDHDLLEAGGELTPTLKVKRNVVYERYADVFEGL